MSESLDPKALLSRRKMVQTVLLKVDRFTWSEQRGRLVLDRGGKIVFLDDVVKIIEGHRT